MSLLTSYPAEEPVSPPPAPPSFPLCTFVGLTILSVLYPVSTVAPPLPPAVYKVPTLS